MKQSIIGASIVSIMAMIGACDSQELTRSERERALLGDMTIEEAFSDPTTRALSVAACEGNMEAIERMRGHADPNARGSQDTTPLLWAMNCRSTAGVEGLLRLGADPNQIVRGARGDSTPVFVAAGNDNPSILSALLRHGGDPNASYEGGSPSSLERAFSLGMRTHSWDNYYVLLDAGADINRRAGSWTIAEVAADTNQFDKVAELLDRGYNHNLPYLGLAVQRVHEPTMPPGQIRWAARVQVMLEERGVRFPVTPQDAGLSPPEGNE